MALASHHCALLLRQVRLPRASSTQVVWTTLPVASGSSVTGRRTSTRSLTTDDGCSTCTAAGPVTAPPATPPIPAPMIAPIGPPTRAPATPPVIAPAAAPFSSARPTLGTDTRVERKATLTNALDIATLLGVVRTNLIDDVASHDSLPPAKRLRKQMITSLYDRS